MHNDSEKLTDAELKEGWHFCNEMDGLLANCNDPSGDCFCELFKGPRKSDDPGPIGIPPF